MGDVVHLGFGKFSGPELPHGSTRIWGLPIFGNDIAHFYVLAGNEYRSSCGRSVVPARISNGQCGLLGVGSFGRCKSCRRPRRGRGSY